MKLMLLPLIHGHSVSLNEFITLSGGDAETWRPCFWSCLAPNCPQEPFLFLHLPSSLGSICKASRQYRALSVHGCIYPVPWPALLKFLSFCSEPKFYRACSSHTSPVRVFQWDLMQGTPLRTLGLWHWSANITPAGTVLPTGSPPPTLYLGSGLQKKKTMSARVQPSSDWHGHQPVRKNSGHSSEAGSLTL